MACRGTGRPAARDAQRHTHEPLRHRALCNPRSRDRSRHGLETVRQPQCGEDTRATETLPAADGAGEKLRHRIRVCLARRSGEDLSALAHRRSRRRRLDPGRWQGESHRPYSVARQRRPQARRADRRGRESDRPSRRARPSQRSALPHRRRRHRDTLRGRRQLRRPMGARIRLTGGSERTALFRRALLPRHPADSRRAPGPASHARPRRLHLLQGRSRRPGHGWLRAGRQTVECRRHSRQVRIPAPARGLGSLRDPDAERDPSHAVSGNRRGEDAPERSREFHSGRQFHSRRGAGIARLLRLRRIQFRGNRQCWRRRQAHRPMDRRRRGST